MTIEPTNRNSPQRVFPADWIQTDYKARLSEVGGGLEDGSSDSTEENDDKDTGV